MNMIKRILLSSAVFALAIGAFSGSAQAFFPPISSITATQPPATIAPIKLPPTTVSPVKIPPVDPCVKPNPKPRHCDCCCSTGTSGDPSNAPEPATLISAGIGMGIAGIAGWVKRKRKAAL